MTTETPKRIQRSRLTHVNAYKLVQWLKDHPEIVRTMTKRALANKAAEELGFPIDWSGMSDIARELNIEIGLPKLVRTSKKKSSENLMVQEQLLKELIKQILISRKWIEVLLRKTFNSPAESTMAFQELYGSSGSMSSTRELEQMPLK